MSSAPGSWCWATGAMSERSRPTWPTRRLPLTSDTPTVARLTDGAAFQRVHAALLAHGRHVHQAGPRLSVSCPGPGHWRSDQVPSLVVTAADGQVLMYCHAGCHTEDVLKAIGLTPADLYDEPHRPAVERPGRAALHEAIGAARGLAVADRYLYLQLLCRADWDTATIPARFQPNRSRRRDAHAGLVQPVSFEAAANQCSLLDTGLN